MRFTSEKSVVASIVSGINSKYPNSWVFKTHGGPMQMAGVPDLIVCIEGQFFGLEVKHQKPGESTARAYGRATDLQLVQLENIERAGGISAVVLSAAEALEVIGKGLRDFSGPL